MKVESSINPYQLKNELLEMKSDSVSCPSLQEALYSCSTNTRLFFLQIDSDDAFNAFETLLDKSENDSSSKDFIEFFLRDECRVVAMNLDIINNAFKTANDILESKQNQTEERNYLNKRKMLFQKIIKNIFTLQSSQQTKLEINDFLNNF